MVVVLIQKIFFLINDCKKLGTLPFSGIARIAFICTKILRSLLDKRLIEKKIGRKKATKNESRVIDIDIIDFNGKIKNKKSKNLILPHPRSHLRNFVLYPILQIDPNWSHPILKKNARFLINNLNQKSRIEITRLQKNVNIKL